MATRSNDCTNPFLKTGSSGWFTTGGARITTATGLDALAGDSAGRATAWEAPAGGGSVVLPNVNGAGLGGQARHHSVYAKASDAGTTATLNLQSYYDDGTATFLGGHNGTAVALTAGQWVRIGHAATLVAPDPEAVPGTPQSFGADQCRTVITTTGVGTVQFSLALFEGEASLALVADPPGSYFDGDSTGGAWTGTNGNSSSTLTVEDEAAVIHGWGTPLPSSDDFTTYTGVPDPTKWDLYDSPGHAGNGLRDPAQNTVADGFLRIHGLTDGTTGALRHVLDQQYGRWEVRLRLLAAPAATGDTYHGVAIIWPTSETWPEDGEYDFFETLVDEDRPEAWLHYPHPEGPTQQEHAVFAQPLDITQWHNYALEWTPDGLVGYVDGVEWFSYSGGAGPGGRSDIQDMASGHLTLQLDAFVATPTLQEAYLDVEWARAYEYELNPVVVQASPVTFSGAAATTLSATLPAPAAAGNALAMFIAGDKDLQPLGADAPVITGFAQTVFLHTGNVSLIIAWREAAGGETAISATIDADASLNLSGSDAFIVELRQAGDGVWEVKGSATGADDGSDLTVKSAGTTGTLTGDGLALAAWAVDSINTKGTADYSDGYVELANPSAGAPGGAGLWVATKPVTVGTTTTATLTRGGAAIDEICGGIVVLGRAADVEVSGAASASLGGLTATATGVVTSVSARADLGGLVATATGLRATAATAAATLGGLTATAAGVRTTAGTASAQLGGLTAMAAGEMTSYLGATGPALNPSVWLVDRDTLAITAPLPDWQALTLSPVVNSPGSCGLVVAAGAPGFAALHDSVSASPQRDQEIEVWLAGTPEHRRRWLLQQKAGDDLQPGMLWTFTGAGLEQLLAEVLVGPQATATQELIFGGVTYGTILITVVQQAQGRAGVLEGVTWDFTTTHDSAGQPWANTITDLKFAPDASLLDVAGIGPEEGIGEFEVSPDRVLRAFNFGTRGVDRSGGGTPLRLAAAANLSEAARRESSRAGDAATAALAKGAEGQYQWATDATAEAQRGRRVEVAVDAGQITSSGGVLAAAQGRLATMKTGVSERTHGVAFGPGLPIPGVDYDVADWALSVTGNAATSQRITQWTVTFEPGMRASGTVRTNDLVADRLVKVIRQLNSVQRGGSVVGTSTPGPDVDDGKAPAQVTGVAASSSAYQDADGATWAAAEVGWTAVTTNADATAADDIDGYLPQYRYTGGAPLPTGWIDLPRAQANACDFDGVVADQPIEVRAAAVDRFGHIGAWSTPYGLTSGADATPPPVPSTPAASNYIGILRVDIDGKGAAGEAMPPDFLRFKIHASRSSGFTTVDAPHPTGTLIGQTRGAGSFAWAPPTLLGGAGYEETWYVKVVAEDRNGNSSAASAQDSAVTGRVEEGDVASVNVGVLTSGISNAIIVNAGIIRSAESGARYELDDASLRFLDADENVTFEGGGPSGAVTMRGTLVAGASFTSGDRIVIDPDYVQPGGAEFPTITLYSAAGTLGPGRINASDQGSGTTALGLNSGPTTTTATYEQSTVFLFPQSAYLSINAGGGGVNELNRRGGAVILTKSEATMVYAPNGIDRSHVEAGADGAKIVGQSLAGSQQSYVWAGANGNIEMTGSSGTLWVDADGINATIPFGHPGNGFSFVAQSGNSQGYRAWWNGSALAFVRNSDNTTVKTFVIDHPTDPDRLLVHATTESPQSGVEYWGEVTITDRQAVVELPPYFESLTTETGRQVQVSVVVPDEPADVPAGTPPLLGPPRAGDPWIQPLAAPRSPEWATLPAVAASTPRSGRFRIACAGPDGTRVAWLVKATRKDVEQFVVEPLRSEVQVHGDGPYRYITPISQEESAA